MKIKRILGNIKRAAAGIIINNFDKMPTVNPAGFVIGYTVSGKEIRCFKIGDGKRKVLFVSGTHGNEVGTVKLASNLLNWLSSQKQFHKDFSFFIMTCLNPDGYEKACKQPDYLHGGMIGRFNANNVDLNRNFDTPSFQSQAFWRKGKNYEEKIAVFSGSRANSEPETRAIITLIKKENIKIAVAFHNAGSDVIGNTVNPSKELAELYGRECGFRVETNKEWLEAKRTGTFKEWSEINKIAFLEIEGSNRWGSDWKKQKDAIRKMIEFLAK